MKKYLIYIVCAASIALAACGGGNAEKKTFKPKDRTTSRMSIEDREAAIEAKRQTLLPVDIDSLIISHGVKFSVMPPAVTENLPVSASDKLASKMIQIAAQNGISGLCTNPVLAMVSKVDCVQRELTGTAPQKAIVKYEVTIYCGNMVTGDIYATAVQTITGVGSTFEDAANKALNELKNNNKMQNMLATASERALKWYNAIGNVKSFVDKAVSEKNYALASALLSSVPQQSSSFNYATKKSSEVSDLMFQEYADALLASMENAIAEGGDSVYNPQAGACLELIPHRSKAYAKAKKEFDRYLAKLDATAKDKRNKEHQLAMKEKELQKIKAPFEAQAAIEMAKADASLKKNEMWSGALSSAAASIGHGMRGGIFGENGLFGKGGVFGIGSFAKPLSDAVGGVLGN